MKQNCPSRCLLVLLAVGVLIGGPWTAAQAQAAPVRVRIELLHVTCFDTEDLTGADEFYICGALRQGGWTQAVLTTPIGINTRQSRSFPATERVILNHLVPEGETVVGGLAAFDEDFAKDWSKRPFWLDAVAAGVAAGVGVADPTAGTIVGLAYGAFGKLASLDKDDRLGTLELIVPASGPGMEEKSWNFKRGGWWSSWNYTVVYRITRTVETVSPPPPPPSCQQLHDQIAADRARLQRIEELLAEDMDLQQRRALLAQRARILDRIAQAEAQLQTCQ